MSQDGYAAIGLHNAKNIQNVGGVLRAAFCFDAAMVAISGVRYRKNRTDTAKTNRHIPLVQVDDLHTIVPFHCVPVAVERLPAAVSLVDYVHPDQAFYVFGAEDSTLGKSVLGWCRDVISIPSTDALNLAAAVNVVLYDRVAKRSAR